MQRPLSIAETHPRRPQIASADDPASALQLQSEVVQAMATRVAHAFGTIRARICRRQNASCAVNNLPAEILAYILQLAATPSAFDGSYETPLDKDASFLVTLDIASTCTHWRALSLGNPFMWSYFDAQTPPKYLELAMSRNQSVPLAILGPLPEEASPELLRVLTDNLHRVRALEISSPGETIRELFEMPAPLLRQLTCYVFDFEDHDGPPLALPAPDAPDLREVTLYQCALDFGQSTRVYEKLTNVTFRLNETTPLDGFCGRLLALCRAAPNLQNLYAITPSILPIAFNMLTPAGSERVRLEKLRSFTLQLPLQPTLDLLASLSLPSHLHDFAVWYHRLDVGKDVYARLWTREHLPATLFAQLQEIKITYHLSHAMALRGVKSVGSVLPGDGVHIGFNIEAPDRATGIIDNCLAPVASYLVDNPLPNLKHLAILQVLHQKMPADSETRKRHIVEIGASVHRLISAYPTLTSLTLRFGSSGILEGLGPHLREPGSSPPLVPSLEKCTIQVGIRVNIPVILSFIRLLLPNQIGELHLEGTVFNARSDQEALDFVQETLPRLAREVWASGSSIMVPGSPLRHNITEYWQKAEECPLKFGELELMPPM